ncbi:MAG: tetratricopeptide repeat protein [Pseudomonadota bacterium]
MTWLTAHFRTVFLSFSLLLLVAACDSAEDRAEKHYQSGLELVESEPEKAILEFRNAVRLNENHVGSHYQLGLLMELQNNLPEAYRRFTKVIDIQPEHVDARIKVARLLMVDNAADRAATEIDIILRLEDNRAEVYALLAAIKLNENDLPAAREALDKSLALDPDDADAAVGESSYFFRTGQHAKALARVNGALEQSPRAVALHLTKLQTLERLGQMEELGEHLQVMVDTFPDAVRFRQAFVNWAIRMERNEIAERELRVLIDLQPDRDAPVTDLIRFIRRERGDGDARVELVKLIDAAEDPRSLQLLLAKYDVEIGDRERAIEDLTAIIADDPKGSNQARMELARLYYEDQNTEAADRLVEAALTEDGRDVEALALLGARQIDTDRLEQATQTIRKGLNEAPSNVRLLQLAARAQELSGNLDLANDRFAAAMRASDFQVEVVERYVQFLIRLGRFTAAETVLSDAVRRKQGDRDLLDLLGFTRIRLEDWLGAEAAAEELRQYDPERAQQLLAAILLGQEKFEEGANVLRDLPSDERRRAASIAALMQTYLRDGDLGEATAFLDDLLVEDPDDLQALGLRGNLYIIEEKYDEAEANYRRILDIDPGNGGAHSALARLYAVKGDAEGSENALMAGLEASPTSIVLLSRLAQLREVQGRFDDAIEVYEELYKRVPDSLLVANNLASLLSDHHADDRVAVERAYTIASRLRPSELPHYRDTYGWTRYLKGEYEEALEKIAPVIEALPTNPWVHYHLGMIYLAMDRDEDAKPHLEQALTFSEGSAFPPRDEIAEKLREL